jgi:hypothetical protein
MGVVVKILTFCTTVKIIGDRWLVARGWVYGHFQELLCTGARCENIDRLTKSAISMRVVNAICVYTYIHMMNGAIDWSIATNESY